MEITKVDRKAQLIIDRLPGFVSWNGESSVPTFKMVIDQDEALNLAQAILEAAGIKFDTVLVSKATGDELARVPFDADARAYEDGYQNGLDDAELNRRPSQLRYGGAERLAYVYGINSGESGNAFLEVAEIGNSRDRYHDKPVPRRYFLYEIIDGPKLLSLDDEWPMF